jgi:hypothetical protein
MATAKHTSLPASVGGLNDRDSIVAMPKEDAVKLINWWPYPSYIGTRKGRTPHVTGFSSPVETLMEYAAEDGSNKFFAASGTGIYDVTTAGAVGSPVVSGLANARWQETMITTAGGSFLVACNGQDTPRVYNGSTWANISVTGVTSTSLVHVCLFKNRLYFTEKNSLEIWYLPTLSIGGAAAAFPLGSVFRRGGYVMACYTWTLDAGNGSDDHLVIVSSKGEIAVYRGTDPSSASDWGLVGVYYVGEPVGRRCGIKYGGDLIVNCLGGVFPLSKALLSATIDKRNALTDKIQNTVSEEMNFYSENFGWQLCLFEESNMLILNVPKGNGSNYQYAQNTITGAWTKFEGWDASCWLYSRDGLFYGDSTSVQKAWQGNLDDTAPIQADLIMSYQYFGDLATNKYFTMVKPYLMANGSPSILYGLCADFKETEPEGTFVYEAPTGMVWGSMYWGTMVWGGGMNTITSGWHTVGTIANAAALRLKVQNNGSEVRLMNVSHVHNHGGILTY